MNYRTVASTVGLVVLIVLLVPFVVYGVPGVVGADHSFVVLSGSMEPTMSPGDAVLVEETDPEAIEEGDVITFARSDEDTPVTHRVIGVESQEEALVFETQGDANDQPDADPVPGESVIGVVSITIPLIGHVVQFVNTTMGFLLFVALPVGLLILTEIRDLIADGTEGATEATTQPTPSDQPQTASDSAAPSGTAATEHEDPNDEDAFTINPADMTITLGVLAVMVPYTVYVAFYLPTVVSITAAFANGFLTIGLASLWISTKRADTGSEPNTTPTRSGVEPEETMPSAVTDVAETADNCDKQSVDHDPERSTPGSPETVQGKLHHGNTAPIEK